MHLKVTAAAAVLVACTACGRQEARSCTSNAECASDATCERGVCTAMYPDDCRLAACSVAIEAPSATSYTNGSVAFQVAVTGRTPDKVELLKDGSLLATLSSPYQFSWDTTTVPEASYQIVARATQGPTTYFSESRTVVVDRTPPQIVSHVPADGDRNVGLHAPMRVTFDEPVSLPVAPEAVVSLTGTGGIALTPVVTLADGGRTLVVAPQSPLAVPADVTLQLRPGITDLAGNPVALPGSWSWHTPVWQMLGPYVAQSTSEQIQNCAFDLDALGRPTVGWREREEIRVARWSGSTWEQIGSGIRGPWSAAEPGFSSGPVIALKPSGEPVVAWGENTDPRPSYRLERVFVRHRTASGWEYLGQNPIGPDGIMMSEPTLAVDSNGGIWLGTREGSVTSSAPSHAIVRRYDGSLYWPQQGSSLNRAEREAKGPKLVFDGGGTLWAAWTESAGFGGIDNYVVFDVFASRFLSGSWAAVGGVLNNNTSAPAYSLRVTTVPGSLPIVTWVERMGTSNYQAWYRAANATGWGSPIAAAASAFFSAPSLGATSTGDLYASGLSAPFFVYRKSPGQTIWEPVGSEEFAVNSSAVLGSSGAGATIRTTASGEVLLLWAESGVGSATYSLYVKRLNR